MKRSREKKGPIDKGILEAKIREMEDLLRSLSIPGSYGEMIENIIRSEITVIRDRNAKLEANEKGDMASTYSFARMVLTRLPERTISATRPPSKKTGGLSAAV